MSVRIGLGMEEGLLDLKVNPALSDPDDKSVGMHSAGRYLQAAYMLFEQGKNGLHKPGTEINSGYINMIKKFVKDLKSDATNSDLQAAINWANNL